ncbi:MAG: hypothetical protein KJ734_10465, partial [Chloroflexi bacterium]|nr:hypothetical protein [Chloroflexota bacterium]
MPEQAQVNIFMELLALLGTFALGLAVGLLVPPVQRFFARLWGSPRSLARGARQAGGRLRDSFRWPSSGQAAEMGGMRGAIAQAVANTLTFR